jgi:tetratricopeptide (TPR) repeat protein
LEQLRAHGLIELRESEDDLRYGSLESLREFGAEQLSPDEYQKAIQLHSVYFISESLEWFLQMRGPDQARIARRFAEEEDNVWAGVERSLQGELRPEDGFYLIGNALRYFEMSGLWTPVRDALDRLIEIDKQVPETDAKSFGLQTLGILRRHLGDLAGAKQALEHAVAIRIRQNEIRKLSTLYSNLGLLHIDLKEFVGALDYMKRCLAIQEVLGPEWRAAQNQMNLGWVATLAGDLTFARENLEASLARLKAINDRWGIAAATGNLAAVAHLEGNLGEARSLRSQSLPLFVELDDKPAVAEELEALASLDAAEAAFERAATLLGAAETLRHEMGSVLAGTFLERIEEVWNAIRKALETEALRSATERGRAMSMNEAVGLALSS